MENKRKPYQLVSREWKKEDTVISLKNTTIGGNNVCLIAGPCAVENEDQIFTICEFLSKKNIKTIELAANKNVFDHLTSVEYNSILQMEKDFGCTITILEDKSFSLNQYKIKKI